MPKELSVVIFDQPSGGVFYVGQDVKGQVAVTNTKPKKKYARIEARLIGETFVKAGDLGSWVKDEFLNQQFVLWEREGSPNNELPPGNHNFPFSLQLQSARYNSMPSSYESPFGRVVYYVEARVVKEGGLLKHDARSQAVIKVLEVVDINRRDLTEPRAQAMDRNLAYTPFSKSPVTVTCRMPRTGYSIFNDHINFEVEVNNPKERRVGLASAQLFKNSKYISGANSRHFCRIVRGAAANSIFHKDQKNFTWSGSIPVPFTEPTTTNFCVQINYYLCVTLAVPMTNSGNMSMNFPITIGTVPVRTTAELDRRLSYQQYNQQSQLPLTRFYSQPALDTYPGQPYPSMSQPPYAPDAPPQAAANPWYTTQWSAAPPAQNPYWDPNSPQASATLPHHWPHSPPPISEAEEYPPSVPPPPSYEDSVAKSAFPTTIENQFEPT